MKILSLIGIMCAILGVEANAQSQLAIEFSNFSEAGGKLYLAIFNSEELFMKKGTGFIFTITEEDLAKKQVPANIELPDDGEYAIIAYQDENGNGELDKGMFGIPKERYGFSNNVKPIMSAPKYDECKFMVKGDTVIQIELR